MNGWPYLNIMTTIIKDKEFLNMPHYFSFIATSNLR